MVILFYQFGQQKAAIFVLLLLLFTNCLHSLHLISGGQPIRDFRNHNHTEPTSKHLLQQNVSITQGKSNQWQVTTLQPKNVVYPELSTTFLNAIRNTTRDLQGSDSKMEPIVMEISNDPKDSLNQQNVAPTTYRPSRQSNALQVQEREKKLMDVLVARRSALHSTGFSSRMGANTRTATQSLISDVTLRSPNDSPRSICIRNCTRNFTQRPTASCMRQCAKFSRIILENSTAKVVILRSTSKVNTGTQNSDRDLNEILLADESSHGLFIVAKEENNTLNHIIHSKKTINSEKLKSHEKLLQHSTELPNVEDKVNNSYLNFGLKMRPVKPESLTITSISDEHPRVLEVSVLPSTNSTPASTVPSPTLSAVERSRSRFKYNIRNSMNINKNLLSSRKTMTSSFDHRDDINKDTVKSMSTTKKPKEYDNSKNYAEIHNFKRNFNKISNTTTTLNNITEKGHVENEEYGTTTPLIVTVLRNEQKSNLNIFSNNTPTSITKVDIHTINITKTEVPIPVTSNLMKLLSTSTFTILTSSSTPSTASTRITVSSTTTLPSPPFPTTEFEDREYYLNFLQNINIDDKTNIIVFLNRSSEDSSSTTPKIPIVTTLKAVPLSTVSEYQNSETSSKVLLTNISNSMRSTVNSIDVSVANTPIRNIETFVGVVETMDTVNLTSNLVGEGRSIPPTISDKKINFEKRHINNATIALVAIGIIPLLAVILYFSRKFFNKKINKNEEDFNVCIPDQEPISPVKEPEGNHQKDEYHNILHTNPKVFPRLEKFPIGALGTNSVYICEEQYSVTSENEFDRSNIRLKSLLGEGNFGQVWKAEADNLSGHFGATRIVAVKTIRASTGEVSLKEEANIMRKLGSHSNVVTLLGACLEIEPHMLIMEYAMRGRLLSLLRAAKNATNILPASVPGGRSLTPLSPRTLGGFALDIACGMEYIAEKLIVHRDLAARNILIDHNGVCKICDFGMSIDLEQVDQTITHPKSIAHSNKLSKFKFDFPSRFILHHLNSSISRNLAQFHEREIPDRNIHVHDTVSKKPALPIRWMAPEALQYQIFTTETDVWAFGILLWEIATLGTTPYAQLSGREVIRNVLNGMRPDLPKEGRYVFYNLMTRCWHKDPYMRPTFKEARLEISRSLHKWIDDDATSDYMDVSGFSEDLEHGMVYFNHRISEFECEI